MHYTNQRYITLESAKAQSSPAKLLTLLQRSLADEALLFKDNDWQTLAQQVNALEGMALEDYSVEPSKLEQYITPKSEAPLKDKPTAILCRPSFIEDVIEHMTRIAATNPQKAQTFFAITQGLLSLPSVYLVIDVEDLYQFDQEGLSTVYACSLPEFSDYKLFYTFYRTESWVSFLSYEREYISFYIEGLRLLHQDLLISPS